MNAPAVHEVTPRRKGIRRGVYLLPRNPEVIVERGKTHEGTRGFEWVVLPVYTAGYVGILVVSGLDGRFGWSSLGLLWATVGCLSPARGR
jgi:hypothetical protein